MAHEDNKATRLVPKMSKQEFKETLCSMVDAADKIRPGEKEPGELAVLFHTAFICSAYMEGGRELVSEYYDHANRAIDDFDK